MNLCLICINNHVLPKLCFFKKKIYFLTHDWLFSIYFIYQHWFSKVSIQGKSMHPFSKSAPVSVTMHWGCHLIVTSMLQASFIRKLLNTCWQQGSEWPQLGRDLSGKYMAWVNRTFHKRMWLDVYTLKSFICFEKTASYTLWMGCLFSHINNDLSHWCLV